MDDLIPIVVIPVLMFMSAGFFLIRITTGVDIDPLLEIT